MRIYQALLVGSVLAAAGCAAERTCQTCCCTPPPAQASVVSSKAAEGLAAALADERRVQAFYNGVMEKYGKVRPFANIVHAEERHEAVIASLMERHGVAQPAANTQGVPTVPGTLRECNQMAAQLERDNIAMYDRLLQDVTEPDIRVVFENLRDASKYNHLPAFERWAGTANTGSPALTRGNGRGGGWGGGWGGGYACAGVCQGPCGLNP